MNLRHVLWMPFLWALTGCQFFDVDEAEEMLAHPVRGALLSSQPDVPLRQLDLNVTDGSLGNRFRPLAAFDTTAAVGQLAGDGTLTFGRIVDAALSDAGEILLVDQDYGVVRVFDESLRPLGEMGGLGDGPGEFRRPTSMFPLPQGFGVLDAEAQRIELFAPEGDSLVPSSRIPLPVHYSAGACAVGDAVFANGVQPVDPNADPRDIAGTGALVHEVDLSGAILQSFSVPYAENRHWMVASTYGAARIACAPERLWVGYTNLGEVHATTTGGDLLWIVRLTDAPFATRSRLDANGRPVSIGLDQAVLRMDVISHVSLLEPGVLAVQVETGRRASLEDPWEVTHRTYVLDALDGSLLASFEASHEVIAARDGLAVLYQELPYPRIAVARLGG